MALFQPVGQVKLTNVALIKYRVSNKKFEIACYRNKAINFRNGIETDPEEVLQTDVIYTNAQQGEQAGKEELEKYFPNTKFRDIVKTILEKGDLQITDKEREHQTELLFKDIANIIAERCCHPDSKRPFSFDSIQAAMKKIHFPVKLDQAAKKQASDCIKKLQEKFIIAKADMKIQLIVSQEKKEDLLTELQNILVVPTDQFEETGKWHMICMIEPAKYRTIEDILKNKLQDGSMEVLIAYVMNKEVTDIENAGTVNLQIRADAKFDALKKYVDSDDEKEEKAKGQSKKEKDKKAKKQEKKKDDDDEDDAKGSKKSKSKKKKFIEEEEKKDTSSKKEIEKDNDKQKEELVDQDVKNAIDTTKIDTVEEKKFKCLTCKDAAYDSNQEFRNHFKTEWHNYNLKKKMLKKPPPPVDEEEFKSIKFDQEFEEKTNIKHNK